MKLTKTITFGKIVVLVIVLALALKSGAAINEASKKRSDGHQPKGPTAEFIRIQDFARIKAETKTPDEVAVLNIEGRYYLPDTLLERVSEPIDMDDTILFLLGE